MGVEIGIAELERHLFEMMAVMNASMRNADRGTHLKIVVSALICAAIVVGIGMPPASAPPMVA
jgi:hypothetical protein